MFLTIQGDTIEYVNTGLLELPYVINLLGIVCHIIFLVTLFMLGLYIGILMCSSKDTTVKLPKANTMFIIYFAVSMVLSSTGIFSRPVQNISNYEAPVATFMVLVIYICYSFSLFWGSIKKITSHIKSLT